MALSLRECETLRWLCHQRPERLVEASVVEPFALMHLEGLVLLSQPRLAQPFLQSALTMLRYFNCGVKYTKDDESVLLHELGEIASMDRLQFFTDTLRQRRRDPDRSLEDLDRVFSWDEVEDVSLRQRRSSLSMIELQP